MRPRWGKARALAAELARHHKETQATRVKLVLCAREAHAKGASVRQSTRPSLYPDRESTR